ncbi:mRNA (N6-adenosine)-methyltransferase KNAG_0G01340 [Huiozyma naganishii CBS 8797]|uniref:mRNA m(6)A methyltransferase n=1 Tax=Huiozyma naganishii (strain ATCC MYA-139 / BCRC 22969 / CBS 8797 / KCTC 17520 / NBRC 10181 / NCYC 3082 / Yp74L-3) TaxID=1071383 RepID=J7S0W4_HUIN7|nr:hypothetical protein KNAG_0G01340 [Kazachstania naganishii CBS 8797]CCK71192.1 hypothetical protein KNAG_0G01340 [Kazachstania naganishii CBS 8797]
MTVTLSGDLEVASQSVSCATCHCKNVLRSDNEKNRKRSNTVKGEREVQGHGESGVDTAVTMVGPVDADVDVVRFLGENSALLLAKPLDGRLRDVHSLYVMNKQKLPAPFDEFLECVRTISQVSGDAVVLVETRELQGTEWVIEFIDTFALQILEGQLLQDSGRGARVDCHDDTVDASDDDDAETLFDEQTPLLDRLMDALDFDKDARAADEYTAPLVKVLSAKLDHILQSEPVSFQLARERAKYTTRFEEYISVCGDPEHARLLTGLAYIVNNKVVSMQWSKLTKAEQHNPQFVQCLETHIHFIPNLKPQTDVTLGDCSYLDTCHKLNSCRYLHYLQYIPESALQLASERAAANTSAAVPPLYTHGYCCSVQCKEPLPPQWIQCDVRKFDFSVLGKFSVVVADPAWNIHMNLPYGTCNDVELLELPLDQLQDEGVLFLWVTGRALELGKESLAKWGYEVVNEVSWIKTNQLGRTIVTGRTGHWLNHSKEHLLVGVKAHPHWLNRHIDIDVIVSTTRETSRKPDELYGIIERLVGPHARKLEIFGRDHNIRPGWFTIGNQLTGTRIHELDVKERYREQVADQPRDPRDPRRDHRCGRPRDHRPFASN